MIAVPFDPGLFTARIDLEAPVEVSDGQGGLVTTFALVSRHWARIEPVRSASDELGHVLRDETSHRIWIRAVPGVATGMRFRKGARNFLIETVRDPDESGRYLVCACREERS